MRHFFNSLSPPYRQFGSDIPDIAGRDNLAPIAQRVAGKTVDLPARKPTCNIALGQVKQDKTRRIGHKESLEAASNAQSVCFQKPRSLNWSIRDRAERPSHRKGVGAEGLGAAMSVGKVAALVKVQTTHHRTGDKGETSSCMANGKKGMKV